MYCAPPPHIFPLHAHWCGPGHAGALSLLPHPGVALAALIPSFFGMNVVHGLPDRPALFFFLASVSQQLQPARVATAMHV